MRWRVEINAVHIRYIVLSWIRLHSLLFNIQLSSNSTTIRSASHEMLERYRLPRHISSILYLRIAPLAGQSSWQSANCWLSISGLCLSSSVGWTEGGFQKSKFLSRPSSRKHVSSCFSVERWSHCYSSDQFVLPTIPQYSICFPGMLSAWCESTTEDGPRSAWENLRRSNWADRGSMIRPLHDVSWCIMHIVT